MTRRATGAATHRCPCSLEASCVQGQAWLCPCVTCPGSRLPWATLPSPGTRSAVPASPQPPHSSQPSSQRDPVKTQAGSQPPPLAPPLPGPLVPSGHLGPCFPPRPGSSGPLHRLTSGCGHLPRPLAPEPLLEAAALQLPRFTPAQRCLLFLQGSDQLPRQVTSHPVGSPCWTPSATRQDSASTPC